MVTKTSKSGGSTGVSPAIIAVAAVVVLLFVGWLAYINLFAPAKPAPMDSKGVQNQSVLAGLAKKCQGDFSKLSPEDQATAQKLAGGYAAAAIANLYKNPTMGQ